EFWQTEVYAPGLLDWLGVPYTGCSAHSIAIARNKPLTKYLLRGAGLPTADFFLVEKVPVRENPLGWPVIVKPASEDASVGIDQASVVTNLAALRDRVEYVISEFGPPVLIEQYISGREFHVAVAEMPDLQLLPVCEIMFNPEQGDWPITTYNAKWNDNSYEFEATPWVYPEDIPRELMIKFEDIGPRTFRLLGCRDLARLDLRVSESQVPYIL